MNRGDIGGVVVALLLQKTQVLLGLLEILRITMNSATQNDFKPASRYETKPASDYECGSTSTYVN